MKRNTFAVQLNTSLYIAWCHVWMIYFDSVSILNGCAFICISLNIKKTEIVTIRFKNFATIDLKDNVRMCNIELLCKNRSEVCYTSTLKQLANVKCKIRAKASLWLIPSINSASGLFINVEKFHIKQKWSGNIGFLAKLNMNFSARQTTVQYMIWNNANTWKWKCCVVQSMIKSRLDAWIFKQI